MHNSQSHSHLHGESSKKDNNLLNVTEEPTKRCYYGLGRYGLSGERQSREPSHQSENSFRKQSVQHITSEEQLTSKRNQLSKSMHESANARNTSEIRIGDKVINTSKVDRELQKTGMLKGKYKVKERYKSRGSENS